MASVAHLSGEERIGLGIAAAAHVALVAVLVLYDKGPPKPVTMPERMEVSLASEVSLTSTAPDPAAQPQAAVAPDVAPEPEPITPSEPSPRQVVHEEPKQIMPPPPKPRVTSRPTPTPSPRATQSARAKPTPAPKPSPAPSKRPTGSRLGDDFLKGAGASDGADSGSAARAFGPAEQASLAQAISRQLKPNWAAPQGPDAELLITVVRFRLNRDGSLNGNPEIVSQSGVNATNATQKARHAEQAIRAVRLAAPFKLPEEFYDKWKTVTSQFDRRL